MGTEKQLTNDDELLQLVSFKLGNEEFAVDILIVQEINKMIPITKVPNSPEFVEGIINLRGRVIPVVDLRNRFKLGKKQSDKDTRIIVTEINGKTIGFIVDAVNEVLRIPRNITEAPPELSLSIESKFVKSIGKLDDRLIILIDLEQVFLQNEIEELSEIEL
jgi:purine-binding chemotaxis protein CheW